MNVMGNAHISIPLGIIIGLLASFVQSLGLTIQRKSHVLNQNLPESKQRVEHRRPLWLLGFAIFISSNILGSLVQIASLPVVILAPLGAVSLLWNAFFARFILGDVFSPWMILGTILIAGGAVLIAVFGIVPEQTRSLEDLLELFSRPAFVAYFSLLGVIVFVCLVTTHITDFSLSRRIAKNAHSDSLPLTPPHLSLTLPTNPSALTTGVTDTINESILTERTPLLDRKPGNASPSSPSTTISCKDIDDEALKSINRTRLVLAISYASISGIISGMCLLFAKSGVELLLLTLQGHNQFWRWQAWILVLGLIVFALLQLWYLHKALILADPTLVCPSAFCFYNLSSIVNGLVYFNQFSLIPPIHLGLVILGIIVLLGGVWVVSIQSGGGGVDVGTWNEEASVSDEESIGERERRDVEEGPERQQSERQIGPVPMERETVSESNLPGLSASPDTLDSIPERQPPSAATLAVPSGGIIGRRPRSPLYGTRLSLGRRQTFDPRLPSTSSQHFRVASYPHSHTHSTILHGPISPPLATVSTLGAGFQIGLSPVSPGFTLVPRERRRRMTGLGSELVDVVRDTGEQERRRERRRRRTVSEGDAGRRIVLLGSEDDGLGDDHAVSEEASSEVLHARPQNSKSRWRWLREVFTDRT
ncbi:hypothetical protein BDQ12DRAFT_646977 [Crucibulum laeve]|uniref:Magnesium transporter NIPA-domain-containing protein n=1 Tax=Crucibulum laeve TaxID=68775 RepID=A0A5C3MIY1_9AGAR|nr:hypothetical protein BDQ12DRAFT_646977 [Crucibulum laeve]